MASDKKLPDGCAPLFLVIGIGVLMLVLFKAFGLRPAAVPAEPVPVEAPLESVTAPEILAAFDANERAAKKRFVGAVNVEGRVKSITSVLGSPALDLAGRNDYETITAVFGSEANDSLADMVKGTTVHMRCRSVSDVITPQLGDCMLLSQSTDAP